MHQNNRSAVRLRGRYVHIRHPQLLAVIDQWQQVDGIGVWKAFEVDAVRLAFGELGGSGSKGAGEEGGADCAKENATEDAVHGGFRKLDNLSSSWPGAGSAIASSAYTQDARARVKHGYDEPNNSA